MTTWLASLFLVGGAAVCLLASTGVLRLQDFFMRMHAATKAGTLRSSPKLRVVCKSCECALRCNEARKTSGRPPGEFSKQCTPRTRLLRAVGPTWEPRLLSASQITEGSYSSTL